MNAKHPQTPHWIEVTGTYEQCGEILGTAQHKRLTKRVEFTRRTLRSLNVPTTVCAERITRFRKYLEAAEPGWLAEQGALAKAAELTLNDVLLLNCLPNGVSALQGPGENCTSFLAVTDALNILFKIRDERNYPQSFHTQHTTGRYRFQCGRDIGNIGAAHVINEMGLAGACNTGSHTQLVGNEPKLNDCHILRFFAENAATVDEIPGLYRDLMAKGVTGGAGAGRGAIYLLADPKKGLMLECVENDLEATFMDQGTLPVANHFLSANARKWSSKTPNTNTTTRLQRMRELLENMEKPPRPSDVFQIARDREYAPDSLCNDDSQHPWMTLSAQLHLVARKKPAESMSFVCCGNPIHSAFLPITLDTTETFEPLLNGDFYARADSLYKAFRCEPHMTHLQEEVEATGRHNAAPEVVLQYAYSKLRELAPCQCPEATPQGRTLRPTPECR